MQPKPSLKVIATVIASAVLFTACGQKPIPGEVSAGQNSDAWTTAEVTRDQVKRILEKSGGHDAIRITDAREILIQGANNKTVTVNLQPNLTGSPDQIMTSAANTLLVYSRILLKNQRIETVEVCLLGNPEPNHEKGKIKNKEIVRIAITRTDLQNFPKTDNTPLETEQYHEVYQAASWYKIHPLLYKSLIYKGSLKTRAYKK